MNLEEILLKEDVTTSIKENFFDLLDLIPEIKPMIGFDHKNPQHHLDVWNHTLLALSLSKPNFDIRLCLLLHDIGKPYVCIEGKIRHFKNHPKVSAILTKNILNRLGYDEEYINYITYIVENHDTPITEGQIKNHYKEVQTLYEVQTCDALAHHPDQLQKRIEYLKLTKEKINKYSMRQ